MIPDIGTTRFGTYVEIIAPHNAQGMYGADGMYANNAASAVRVECDRPADTNLITIGPTVVSWNGRMISTVMFVDPRVQPNSSDWRALQPEFRIPIRVVTPSGASNTDTFYIVRPQTLGNVRGRSERVLGQGTLGIRSRRGAMIVDSLLLASSPPYTVTTSDPDPTTPGNQGYLPVTILSPGSIQGVSGTVIDVSANTANGGPGGGGGGGGYANNILIPAQNGFEGGSGFTGGGPGGDNNTFGSSTRKRPGAGTGSEPLAAASTIDGGSALNGTPGGTSTTAFENAGGGTGHPFGESGHGCSNKDNCAEPGRHGGGSGYRETRRGGGGGNEEAGRGDALPGGGTTGGQIHGNAALVPLAGGSGGASGNPDGANTASSGGGGGGAISVHALRLSEFDIRANGAVTSRRDVGAGGGSGGGIIVGSRLDITGFIGTSVNGGEDASFFNAGGRGRRRYDARGIDRLLQGVYNGAGVDTLNNTLRRATITGYGNGNDVVLWLRGENGSWAILDTVRGYASSWQRQYSLPGLDTLYYLAVAQRIPNASSSQYSTDPQWVMSQSGWNIIRIYGPPILRAPADTSVGTYACPGSVKTDTIWISNDGESPLEISSAQFPSNSGFRIVEPTVFPDTVPAVGRKPYVIEFVPAAGQSGAIAVPLTLVNNDTAAGKSPWTTTVRVNVAPFTIRFSWRSIDLTPRGDTLNLGHLCIDNPQTEEITIRNVGLSPASLQRFRSTAPGLITATSNLPFTLNPPAGVRNLTITFTAKQEGRTVVPMLVDIAECDVPDTIWVAFVGVVPRMSIVGDLQFGDVQPGSSIDKTVAVRNDGTSILTITALPALQAPFSLVGTSPGLPATLRPGEALNIRVAYAPVVAGDDSATLRISSDVVDSSCADSTAVVLFGRSRAARYSLSRTFMDLGTVSSCDSSADSVTILNTGTTPLTLLYPAFINGIHSLEFEVVNQPTVDFTIAPGESVTYTVVFRGGQPPPGMKTASLLVRTRANGGEDIVVPLTANRIDPEISGPRFVNVGIVSLGTPSQRTIRYDNTSAVDVTIARTATTDSRTTATVTSTQIQAGTGFDLNLTINALSEGRFQDTIWVVLDEPCVDSLQVIVVGNSVSGRIRVPNALFLGTIAECATSRDSILISNPGDVAVDVIDITLVGTDAALFAVENPGDVTNIQLGPSESRWIYFAFDPRTSSDGRKQAIAQLRVRINNQPTVTAIQLEGVRRSALPAAPEELVFGAIDIGAAASGRVVMVNAGSGDVRVTAIRLAGTFNGIFAISPGAVPRTLAADELLELPVSFTPPREGNYVDSIIVEFDQPCVGRRVVPLRGIGRLNVELVVVMPRQRMIDPSTDNHRWAIRGAVASAQTPIQNARLRLTLQYATDMFAPIRIDGGTLISANSTGGLTQLEIELGPLSATGDTTELGAVLGDVTLGLRDSTAIDVIAAELLVPNATPSVRPLNGFMTTTICREGGDRFVDRVGALAMFVKPQPVADRLEASIEVFEPGDHVVTLVNTTGDVVATWTWTHHRGQAPYQIAESAMPWSSGMYTLILRTPTRMRSMPVRILR